MRKRFCGRVNKILEYNIEEFGNIRSRIGMLSVANAGITENDMFSMRPRGVFLHFTRIAMEKEINISNLANKTQSIDEALSTLMPGREDIKIICYNCTSGSLILGEEKIINQIENKYPHVKGTTMLTGVIKALRTINANKISIGTAYTEDINIMEQEFFEKKGFHVLKIEGLSLVTDKEMNEVSSQELLNFIISLDDPNAEAIFISCGGLRVTEIIETAESLIKKPIITSNQASFWNCLRLAEIDDNITQFGKLFKY